MVHMMPVMRLPTHTNILSLSLMIVNGAWRGVKVTVSQN